MSTTSVTELEELADAELVDAVRTGSQDAYAVLWNRHSGAGRAAARRVTHSFDPDDLVQESFLRILRAIHAGNGPTGPFRPYLYQTVRSVAVTWSRSPAPIVVDEVPDVVDPVDVADTVVDGSVTVSAFKALPERWQAVLWYTEVEGMSAREVAPLLGLSASSVSALAYRAREGLRRSWLQAHVNLTGVPDECRWAVEQVGDYHRDAMSPRNKDRFEEHLTGCLSCSIVVDEVDQVASRLGLLLVPLVLGVPAVLGAGSAALGGTGTVKAVGAFIDPTAPLAVSTPVAPGGGAGAASGGVTGAHVPADAGAGGSAGSGGAGVGAGAGGATSGAGVSGGAILALVTVGVAVASGAVLVAQPWGESDQVVAQQPASNAPGTGDEPVAPTIDSLALVPRGESGDPSAVPPPAPGEGEGENVAQAPWAAAPEPEAAQPFARSALPSAPAQGSAEAVAPTEPPLAPPVVPLPVPPVDPPVEEPVDPAPPVTEPEEPVDDGLAAPSLVDPPQGELLYLPVLSGTGEPGAVVTVSAISAGVSSVVATADVQPDGTWKATASGDAAGWDALSVTQERDGVTSKATSLPGPIAFVLPLILTPVDGASVPWGPSITVRIDGRAGSTTEAFIDGVSTGNLHPMSGKPIDLVTRGLGPGRHSLGLRYVDPATGAVGPTVTSTFTVTTAPIAMASADEAPITTPTDTVVPPSTVAPVDTTPVTPAPTDPPVPAGTPAPTDPPAPAAEG
jgi:RNA polymerase sigma factor (sigma-70 family)